MLSQGLAIACGLFNLAFAFFHFGFPKRLHWNRDLGKLMQLNQGIIRILNWCMVYVFTMVGGLEVAFSSEIVTTSLGRGLLVGMAVFWGLRTALQAKHFGWRFRANYVWAAVFSAGALLHIAAAV